MRRLIYPLMAVAAMVCSEGPSSAQEPSPLWLRVRLVNFDFVLTPPSRAAKEQAIAEHIAARLRNTALYSSAWQFEVTNEDKTPRLEITVTVKEDGWPMELSLHRKLSDRTPPAIHRVPLKIIVPKTHIDSDTTPRPSKYPTLFAEKFDVLYLNEEPGGLFDRLTLVPVGDGRSVVNDAKSYGVVFLDFAKFFHLSDSTFELRGGGSAVQAKCSGSCHQEVGPAGNTFHYLLLENPSPAASIAQAAVFLKKFNSPAESYNQARCSAAGPAPFAGDLAPQAMLVNE